QVRADSGRLEELQIAINERRDAPERVDLSVGGALLLARREVHARELVGNLELLEEPADARRAGLRSVIELHRLDLLRVRRMVTAAARLSREGRWGELRTRSGAMDRASASSAVAQRRPPQSTSRRSSAVSRTQPCSNHGCAVSP